MERDERARQEDQDPDVGDDKAGVVGPEGKALDHREEDVRAEQRQDQREPPRQVDVALGGRRAVLHLVERGESARPGEHEDHDHREAQRRESVQQSRSKGSSCHWYPREPAAPARTPMLRWDLNMLRWSVASVKLLLSRLRLVFDADARTGFARWWNDVHGRADASGRPTPGCGWSSSR